MPCHLPDANSLVNSQNLFIFVLTVCKEKSKVCSAFGPSEEEGYLNMLAPSVQYKKYLVNVDCIIYTLDEVL